MEKGDDAIEAGRGSDVSADRRRPRRRPATGRWAPAPVDEALDAVRGVQQLAEVIEAEAASAVGRGESQAMYLGVMAGRDVLFVARVRPHDGGAYHQPMIELLALCYGLQVDAVVSVMSGRTWSLDDPIVPVTDGADLRQRVLSVTIARRERPLDGYLRPIDAVDGGVHVGEPVMVGPGEGWLPGAVGLVVSEPWPVREPEARTTELLAQLRRCVRRGHNVRLSSAGSARFTTDGTGDLA